MLSGITSSRWYFSDKLFQGKILIKTNKRHSKLRFGISYFDFEWQQFWGLLDLFKGQPQNKEISYAKYFVQPFITFLKLPFLSWKLPKKPLVFMQFPYLPSLSSTFLYSPQAKTHHLFDSNPKGLHPCNLSKGFLDFKSSQQLWSFGSSCEEKGNWISWKRNHSEPFVHGLTNSRAALLPCSRTRARSRGKMI